MQSDLAKYRKSIEEIALNLVKEFDLLMVDLQLLGRGRRAILRLFVDKKGGVNISECSKLSRRLGRQLEDLDVIPFGYRLEVSSPGVETPFQHREQYSFHVGQRVKVELFEKKAEKCLWEGTLAEVNDAGVTIHSDSGEDLRLAFDEIKEARQVVVFKTS